MLDDVRAWRRLLDDHLTLAAVADGSPSLPLSPGQVETAPPVSTRPARVIIRTGDLVRRSGGG
ncbi:hypothetical protein [Actinophytocola sp.]|uniref:hypothetical protein n=1 Tax=Actinophytocola sp. TaxID=1872138 RepID=UPI0038998B17